MKLQGTMWFVPVPTASRVRFMAWAEPHLSRTGSSLGRLWAGPTVTLPLMPAPHHLAPSRVGTHQDERRP